MMVIFDLDGTLFHSERATAQADFDTFAAMGWPVERLPEGARTIETQMRGWASRRKFDAVAQSLGMDPQAVEGLYAPFRAERNDRITAYVNSGQFDVIAGVEETLAHVQRRAWIGAASNNPHARAWAAIRIKGLDRFFRQRLVMGADQVGGRSKPDPAMLVYLMRLQGFTPRETIMVGDSEADMRAAKAAGMHALAFADPEHPGRDAWVQTLQAAGADAVFDRYSPHIWDTVVATLPRAAGTPRLQF